MKELGMYAYMYQELARQRHAELIREAQQHRLAAEARRGQRGQETRTRRISFAARLFPRRRPAVGY